MTTLLVASSGGHLAELVELADRLPLTSSARHWVTFRGPQSEGLLAGERVTYLPEIRERDARGVVRGTRHAIGLFAGERFDTVISTGSGIALAFLPYAALLGIDVHFIESACRVHTRSMTGRVLSGLPRIRLYRQFPEGATSPWHHGGSVFDNFETRTATAPPLRRAVVTVGIRVAVGFRRLIERLAEILPSGLDVLWQTGPTPVDGLGIKPRPVVPALELQNAMRDADVVISHAGCGSALTALKVGKCPILVPRAPALGEVIDDHQTELAVALAERGLAIHRSPQSLTLADLEAAAARRVVRVADPPPFRLMTTR